MMKYVNRRVVLAGLVCTALCSGVVGAHGDHEHMHGHGHDHGHMHGHMDGHDDGHNHGVYNMNHPSYVVNVTAKRAAALDLQTPASVNVMTAKDIANTGARNAFDAVNFIAGVPSFSYGASGLEYGAMDSRVNIRGLERGSLVLVNGTPFNLNGKGGLSSIPVEAIQQVEVMKGSASALYGSEALSGVINIITKTPVTTGGKATVSVGNHGAKSYNVSYGTPDFTFGVKKEFFGRQAEATPIRKDIDGRKGYEYYTARDKGDVLGIYASAKLSDQWTLNFNRSQSHSAYAQLSTQENETLQKKNSTTYKYDDVKNGATLVYKEGTTTGKVFYNDRNLHGYNRKHNKDHFISNESDYLARQYGVDLQHEWDLRDGRDTFIGGVLWKKETYKTTSAPIYAHPHRNSYAIYGSYAYEINPQWNATVGARYSVIKDPVKNQNVFTPQFQVMHTPKKDTTWYVNVGKAFTMPNLSDTFKSVKKKYTSITGPNLKPQEGWNYELGYKKINKTDSWKVALYHMDFKNFFAWKKDENGQSTIRVNGGRFENVGVEVEYGKVFNDHLQGKVGVSYSNPKKQEIDSTVWEQANPKVQFTTSLDYSKDAWKAGTSLQVWAKRLKNRDGGTNPNLVQWNAYVGYDFNQDSSIRLDLRNILDRKNVISNGDWEYWGAPFSYEVSYSHRF